jgi:hypothetical protein
MAGTYQISSYQVEYGAALQSFSADGRSYGPWVGRIVCRAEGTVDRLIIGIVPDDKPIPGGVTLGSAGFIWIHVAHLGTFVDLLRNEKPVYMRIVDAPHSAFNLISTSREPVGEGEE